MTSNFFFKLMMTIPINRSETNPVSVEDIAFREVIHSFGRALLLLQFLRQGAAVILV